MKYRLEFNSPEFEDYLDHPNIVNNTFTDYCHAKDKAKATEHFIGDHLTVLGDFTEFCIFKHVSELTEVEDDC